ncbi:MAG TPA: hypothetical protein VNJ53_03530 [Gaiellaceae bacterium]|nr:hypothetical protein [Gaiellaceae bacterium]
MLVVVTTSSVAALTAGAAPAPSSTLTVTCPSGYPNPGEGPGVGIEVRSPTGVLLDGEFYDCDVATRYSKRIPGLGATVRWNCWNGYIQSGSGSTSKDVCVDQVTGATIAKFTVRLPRLPQYAAGREGCQAINGVFAAPGTDVTGSAPPGSTLLYTCNDWAYLLNPAPSPSAWLSYCGFDGGNAVNITSNGATNRGISCYFDPP